MPKDPNEVGAGWRKTSRKGDKYLSISLDLEVLLALNGGTVEKVNLVLFPIDGEKLNDRAPDFRAKFFPREGGSRVAPASPAPAAPPATEPLFDDDIPF